jgi:hypothetical protein
MDIKQIFDETKTHHNRLDLLYEIEQDATLTSEIVREDNSMFIGGE